MRRLKSVERAVNPAPLLEHNFNLLDGSLIWEKFYIEFSAFTAEAAFETILLKSIPSSSIFMGVRLTPEEAWGGGSITAVTLELGVTGDEDKFLSAFNVEGSPSAFGFNWDPMAIGWGSTVPMKVTVRTTGGNVSDLEAGAATFQVGYSVVG